MIESKYLKDNMQNIQRLLDIPALKHFEIKNLAKLLRLSKIKEYEDGELIIKEGDMDPWLYFLLKGGVVIKKEDIEKIIIYEKLRSIILCYALNAVSNSYTIPPQIFYLPFHFELLDHQKFDSIVDFLKDYI